MNVGGVHENGDSVDGRWFWASLSTKMVIRWMGIGFERVCPRKWRFGGWEVMNVGGVHENGDSVDEKS